MIALNHDNLNLHWLPISHLKTSIPCHLKDKTPLRKESVNKNKNKMQVATGKIVFTQQLNDLM